MKFGLYLKNKGVISAEQLVSAIDCQHNRMPPMGQLALEAGILSPREVFSVLRCQSDIPHERFGEVAVTLGVMTPAQLQRLLMIQWERKPDIGEVLVNQGVLSHAQAEAELAAYRQAMERRNVVITRHVPSAQPAPSMAYAVNV